MTAASTTTEQRMTSLERANEIRLARARLKEAIARGEVFAASVLLDPPPEAYSWEVADVLRSQRQWGVHRARRFLARKGVRETKPLGALTERQRRELAQALGGKVNGSAGGRV